MLCDRIYRDFAPLARWPGVLEHRQSSWTAPAEHRGDGAFPWHERLRNASRLTQARSRCACSRTPRRARTSPAPSNPAQRLDCGAFTAAFPRSAAVLKTSRSTSACRSFLSSWWGERPREPACQEPRPTTRCDWSCGHSHAPADICVTTSLTCFRSPRRGHSVSSLLLARYASCQLRRMTSQEAGERFTFSPGRRPG